jgi:hypothetical protein
LLHLLARLKIVSTGGYHRRLADAMPAAEGGQGGIRQLRSTGQQIFMDSHEIPLAVAEKLQDLLPVGLGFLGTV